jgi:hypothetical protein
MQRDLGEEERVCVSDYTPKSAPKGKIVHMME